MVHCVDYCHACVQNDCINLLKRLLIPCIRRVQKCLVRTHTLTPSTSTAPVAVIPRYSMTAISIICTTVTCIIHTVITTMNIRSRYQVTILMLVRPFPAAAIMFTDLIAGMRRYLMAITLTILLTGVYITFITDIVMIMAPLRL